MAAVGGRQWPFSSYCPVKEYQNIIGLDDISPEEVRYIMYSAKESGTVEDCRRHWNELLQSESMKRTLLMSPSVEADKVIKSIYRSKDQQSPNPIRTGAFQSSQPAATRTAAESHTASIFGGSFFTAPFSASANPANGFFGATASTSANSPFGTAPLANVFGGGNSTGVFGSANSSIFGGSSATTQPASSVFGGAPSGLFSAAAAAVAQQSGGFFKSAVAQPVPGLATPTAGPQQTTGGFFGFSAAQPPSGLFASAAANCGFGEPATVSSSSIFGGSWAAQPSVFGGTSHTSSLFSSGQQTSALPVQDNNKPFNKPNVPSNLFNRTNDGNGSVYTPMTDLEGEESAAFLAKTFTSGKIPMRPPPRELCV